MIRPQLAFADLWSRENLDERTIHSPVVGATGGVWWPGAQQETPDSGSTPLSSAAGSRRQRALQEKKGKGTSKLS